MRNQQTTPRRSPRGHKGSYPRRLNQSKPCAHNSTLLFQNLNETEHDEKNGEDGNGLSSPEVDCEGLQRIHSLDQFPSPPPPMPTSNKSSSENDEPSVCHLPPLQQRRPSLSPDTQQLPIAAQTTQKRIVSASTQLLSTSATTSHPPSTRPPTAQAPCRPTHATQSPSECVPVNTCDNTTEPLLSSKQRAGEPTSLSVGNINEQDDMLDLVDGEQSSGPAEVERQRDLKALFVYVNRMSVNNQKLLASAFGVIQGGNKKTRASRLFVILSGMMERKGKTAMELLEEKGTEKGKDLKSDFQRLLLSWGEKEERSIVPPIAELEAESGVRQHPVQESRVSIPIDDASDDEEENPLDCTSGGENFILEEFARLMIIFRDHTEAANDLRRSGQDLQREDLDIGANNRNAFWTTRIEVLFNDPTVLTNERFDGDLSHIDPGRPVTTFRSGASLQKLFAKFRKEFTDLYRRWNVSGNNSPDSFVTCCRLPHQMTLTRAGARSLIAWKVFRFGTENQNSLILDFASKEMSGESGAQLECRFGERSHSATEGRKKKRSSTSGSPSEVNDALISALQSFSREGNAAEESVFKKQRMELEDLAIKNARLENERSIMTNIAEAQKLASQITSNMPGHMRMASIIEQYCGKLASDMEKTVRDHEP